MCTAMDTTIHVYLIVGRLDVNILIIRLQLNKSLLGTNLIQHQTHRVTITHSNSHTAGLTRIDDKLVVIVGEGNGRYHTGLLISINHLVRLAETNLDAILTGAESILLIDLLLQSGSSDTQIKVI